MKCFQIEVGSDGYHEQEVECLQKNLETTEIHWQHKEHKTAHPQSHRGQRKTCRTLAITLDKARLAAHSPSHTN